MNFPLEILTNPNKILIGHNIKFDIKKLEQHFKIKHKCKLYDTYIMHSLLDENSRDNELKQLTATYTSLGHYEDNIDVSNLKNEPYRDVIIYNCLDSIAPLKLFEIFYPQLEQQGLLQIFEFVSEMTSIFVDIEQNGVQINTNKLAALFQKHVAIRDRIKFKHSKTKLSSDAQIRKILYKEFKCPILGLTKGKEPSTGKDILNSLMIHNDVSEYAKDFIKDVLDFRISHKLLTDHIPRIAENLVNGRFHSSYNLAKGYDESGINRGTVTGRLSSSPNIQNIPTQSEIREIFEVSPDYKYFVTADYSQIELRVAAFLSREPNFINAFAAGKDVHTSVMCDIIKEDYNEVNNILKLESHPLRQKYYDYRLAVKRVNFGIMYGIYPKHLVKLILQMGVQLSEQECAAIIDDWYKQNLTLLQWLETVKDAIIKDGYYKTIFGRIRHLPGANRRNETGKRVLRQGINFPIQSAASDIVLLGLRNLHKFFEQTKDSRILMTIHDEINFETKHDNQNEIIRLTEYNLVEKVKNDMLNDWGINFDIPLEVDIHIGNHWSK